MVGEIGVIQEVARRTHCRLNRSDLVADVELELIQAGKHIYAPDADLLTLAERDAIQSVVNKDYKWFVDTVAEQRQISIDSSFDWAEGREFTGDQALEQKLIDQVGSYSDAIGKLKELMQQSLGK
jgi:ClpP class serine protease